MHVLVHVVRGMVKFAISRNKRLPTRRPCIHKGARDTVLLQAFDRLQQRNEALWDAIKTKSEEKSLLDDDKDGGIKSESDIDKSGTCTCTSTYLMATRLAHMGEVFKLFCCCCKMLFCDDCLKHY